MTTTDNFNLNIAGGTDKYNHLIIDNPNYETIDAVMKSNEDAGVQTATELFTQNVHAITRTKSDASAFRFTAVSRFTAGDTFTVDGVPVTALTTSGEALPDGAFIIGSEVFAILKGSLLTIFISTSSTALARDAEKLNGQSADYYATTSALNSVSEVASAAGTLASQNSNSINNLNTNVSALQHRGYGDKIAILDSTTSNRFNVPSDGVVVANTGFTSGAYCYVHVCNSDGTEKINIHVSNPSNSTNSGLNDAIIPVFKDMQLWCQYQGSANTAFFIPFN